MITAGEGKYKVFLEEKKLDDGLIFILGGGERSHIGGFVLCEPEKEPQVIRLEGHYDVFKQAFSAGTVVLGGNLASGAVGAQSNYTVIVQP